MDVRIGITQSGQVIELELDENTDRETLRSQIDEVLCVENGVLLLTDRKGKEVGVSAGSVSFVELSSADLVAGGKGFP